LGNHVVIFTPVFASLQAIGVPPGVYTIKAIVIQLGIQIFEPGLLKRREKD
jgi:hypothetical protein